jgi:uncharacterized membrane protein YhaH (DUF805 family)
MLGYKGRSSRREFASGAGLTFIGPTAFSMVLSPMLPSLVYGMGSVVGGMIMGFALTILTLAAIVLFLWAITVLMVRRARDIGWSAWSGLICLVPLAIPQGLGGLYIGLAWLIVMAVWPGRDQKQVLDTEVLDPA